MCSYQTTALDISTKHRYDPGHWRVSPASCGLTRFFWAQRAESGNWDPAHPEQFSSSKLLKSVSDLSQLASHHFLCKSTTFNVHIVWDHQRAPWGPQAGKSLLRSLNGRTSGAAALCHFAQGWNAPLRHFTWQTWTNGNEGIWVYNGHHINIGIWEYQNIPKWGCNMM